MVEFVRNMKKVCISTLVALIMLSLSGQEVIITFNAEISNYYKKFNSVNSLQEKTIELYLDDSMYLKEIRNHISTLNSSTKTIKTNIKNDATKTLVVEFYENQDLNCSKSFSYDADTIVAITEKNGKKYKRIFEIDNSKKEIRSENKIIKKDGDFLIGSENDKTVFVYKNNELINYFQGEPSSRYLYGLNNTDSLIEAYTVGYGNDTWNLMFENNHILFKNNATGSGDRYKQIINYLILQEYDLVLADIMFEYFLGNFFSLNKIDYSASERVLKKNTVYSKNKLVYIDGEQGSASINGDIGEKIELSFPYNYQNYVYVYTNYQLPQENALYLKKTKLKKIKITNVDNLKSKIFFISDKQELQKLDISSLVKKGYTFAKEVRLSIEILEIYSASKYNNSGFQAILPVSLSE